MLPMTTADSHIQALQSRLVHQVPVRWLLVAEASANRRMLYHKLLPPSSCVQQTVEESG
jgi:hypothetical protein